MLCTLIHFLWSSFIRHLQKRGNREQGRIIDNLWIRIDLIFHFWRSLLVALLRPSNVDPAAGAVEELERVRGMIRAKWCDTQILIRGDSAYS